MDWKYLYFLMSFFVGLLAGFQGIYDRYKKDSLNASITPYGIIYLLTRGALPAVAYLVLYGSNLIETRHAVWALALGTSTEIILRMKFYIREEQTQLGTIELLRGPFDLLSWYQNYFLENIADYLAGSRKRFVVNNLPQGMSFPDLCGRVFDNLNAYPPEQQIIIRTTETAVNKLKAEFEAELQDSADPASVEHKYRLKLGYSILNCAGQRGFKTLLEESHALSQSPVTSNLPP
jgi:hypothetical protein